MTPIGTHYRRDGYNCANFVSDWYRDRLGITIPVVNEFGRSFLVWMRKNFTDISLPEDNCLVLMINLDGSYHVGVYHQGFVHHNFKPSIGLGSVSAWVMSSVTSYYSKVSFHKWSQ